MRRKTSRNGLTRAKRAIFAVAATTAMVLALPASSLAGTISTWGSWNGSSMFSDFGTPDTATYGQVVTVPAGQARLESFTFYLEVPSALTFRAYVYAWSGEKATGPQLYESPDLHTSEEGVYQPITVDTGGVSVTPGEQYVLFFSVSNDQAEDAPREEEEGQWAGGIPNSVYSEGEFVYLNNEYEPAQWTTGEWLTCNTHGYGAQPSDSGESTAFTAVFATQKEVTEKEEADAKRAAEEAAAKKASEVKAAAFEAVLKKIAGLEAAAKLRAQEEAATKKRAEEEARTTVVLDASTLTVTGSGELPVKLTCSGAGTCAGKLALDLKATTGKGRHKHTATEQVAGASFTIPAGKSATIELAIDSAGRTLLKAARGHAAGVLAILKSTPAPAKTLDETVKVEQKTSKRK